MRRLGSWMTCCESGLLGVFLLQLIGVFSSAADGLSGNAAPSYRDWKHSGSMWLLTTPEGAELPATASVDGFPLLVRLHNDFFDYRQAKANGDDLRFSSTSGERLDYQIEDWDAAKGVANVWVRVPKIVGN